MLGTQTEDAQWSMFQISFVTSMMDYITVYLRRDVLENIMKETPTSSSNNFLVSLTQVYNESILSAGINSIMDNELDAAHTDRIDNDHEIKNQEEDAHSPPSRENYKEKIYVLM